MKPTLRYTQVLKPEAEDIGLMGKVAQYVREQQTLDREEMAARRDKKRQVEIRMVELQAQDKKRADVIEEAEERKRADEIKIQIKAAKEQAKIEADKELALKGPLR